MATLEQNEANILDAETVNWQIVVYPLLVVLAIVVAGFGYYYYVQSQRVQLEETARAALVQAKTPEDMAKVADQYPNSDQASIALLGAADAAFAKRDFAGAVTYYQRVASSSTADLSLRDAAQIGLASADEANKKNDDAIKAYLDLASRGSQSPYSPLAYWSAARLYEDKGDKDNQRKMLVAAAGLDPDSSFVKQAQNKLKELAPPITVPVPAMPAPAAAAPPAPAPAAPAPATK